MDDPDRLHMLAKEEFRRRVEWEVSSRRRGGEMDGKEPV